MHPKNLHFLFSLKCICILLLVTGISCCIRLGTSSPVNKPWEPTSKTASWWRRSHEYFVQYSKSNAKTINVLFYGDSITQGWAEEGALTFDKYYVPLMSVNFGIAADRTEHLLFRIQNGEVTNLNPKVVVLMIGTNNMAVSNDLSIAKGIYAVVHELRLRLPFSKLLLIGILPKSNRSIIMERINGINHLLSLLEDGVMIRYLDMTPHFSTPAGNIRKDLYQRDLLHLSAEGYEQWASVMNPLLTEMLK